MDENKFQYLDTKHLELKAKASFMIKYHLYNRLWWWNLYTVYRRDCTSISPLNKADIVTGNAMIKLQLTVVNGLPQVYLWDCGHVLQSYLAPCCQVFQSCLALGLSCLGKSVYMLLVHVFVNLLFFFSLFFRRQLLVPACDFGTPWTFYLILTLTERKSCILERVLIKEAIPDLQPSKLIAQNTGIGRPNKPSKHRLLWQGTSKYVYVIWAPGT